MCYLASISAVEELEDVVTSGQSQTRSLCFQYCAVNQPELHTGRTGETIVLACI